jgi:hypothetical protein
MVNRINKTPAAQTPININPTKGVDALIENLENQIRQVKASVEEMPYHTSPSAENGMLFNLFS